MMLCLLILQVSWLEQGAPVHGSLHMPSPPDMLNVDFAAIAIYSAIPSLYTWPGLLLGGMSLLWWACI